MSKLVGHYENTQHGGKRYNVQQIMRDHIFLDRKCETVSEGKSKGETKKHDFPEFHHGCFGEF